MKIQIRTCACVLAIAGVSAAIGWSATGSVAKPAAGKSQKSTKAVSPATKAPVKARASGPARGSVLGRFEVPVLNMSWVVLEGTDDQTLTRGVGHVERTPLLGNGGNIGLAAHRNTHFRKLEWLRRGDEIVLSSKGEEYRYRVESLQIHKPTDVDVLRPTGEPAMTLVTCFPFEYVGAAPLRLIVRAVAVEETRARLLTPPQAVPTQVAGN